LLAVVIVGPPGAGKTSVLIALHNPLVDCSTDDLAREEVAASIRAAMTTCGE
jgi:adenylate kinase family enzyme